MMYFEQLIDFGLDLVPNVTIYNFSLRVLTHALIASLIDLKILIDYLLFKTLFC